MRELSATKIAVLLIILVSPSVSQSSPADGPWFGQIQCQLNVQQQGYARQEVQIWALTSNMPVGKNGDMQLYSATWTATGQGGFQRALGQRASLAQWNINVPPTNASIAMFVRGSDGQFIIRIWQRPTPSYTGIRANRQMMDNGAGQQISSTVHEWVLPWIQAQPGEVTQGKLSVPTESLGADLTPPGAAPTAECVYSFSRKANAGMNSAANNAGAPQGGVVRLQPGRVDPSTGAPTAKSSPTVQPVVGTVEQPGGAAGNTLSTSTTTTTPVSTPPPLTTDSQPNSGQPSTSACMSDIEAQYQQITASLQKSYDTLIQQARSAAACAVTAATTPGTSVEQQKVIAQQQQTLEQMIAELQKQEQQVLEELPKEKQQAIAQSLKDPKACQALVQNAAALNNSLVSVAQETQNSSQASIANAQQVVGVCSAPPMATSRLAPEGKGAPLKPTSDVAGVLVPNAAPTGTAISNQSTPSNTVAPTTNTVSQNVAPEKQAFGGSARAVNIPLQAPLWGWADLHTHPMSNLAFGGKLFHGAPDVGSLMPAVQMPYDPECRFDNRARTMEEALSDDAPTHGDVIQSRCGNSVRNALIQVLEVANDAMHQPGHAVGAPTFANWPRWNDITHQKMWVDWIRRARDGGLRVMVALSHNNRLLGEAMGSGGPITGSKDDVSSSDLQVAEIRSFVGRHNDFMEVALTSADLYRIVQAGKIAVVVGVEIDNFGNFIQKAGLSNAAVDAEIGRLYAQGVRYIIPIHLTDNVFGDTALYDPLFNAANFRENGRFWTVGCASAGDLITYQSFNFPQELNAFIPPGSPQPPRAPACPNGHINGRTPGGLTTLGQYAVKAMMKRGIIIDIDHMSHHAVETALQMAWDATPAGYPMMSGHSGVRDGNEFGRENSRTPAQLEKIACLGGMFGVGTADAEAYQWAREYVTAYSAMTHAFAAGGKCPDRTPLGPGIVAFGTDTNSLVGTPRPTMVEFKSAPRFSDVYNGNNPNNTDNPKLSVLPRSSSGSRTWDYNNDGVAHYGMFAEFVRDVRMGPAQQGMTGKDLVDNHLLSNADYFYRMWQKAETQAANVH